MLLANYFPKMLVKAGAYVNAATKRQQIQDTPKSGSLDWKDTDFK